MAATSPLGNARAAGDARMSRRTFVCSGAALAAAAGWSGALGASGEEIVGDEIVLGVSAAFSGPSRALGHELYRGAMAWFSEVNDTGGIGGRRITLRLLDDGYQPDPCVENTLKLMLEEKVFLLFGYVGTPTVTRVLPMLKKFQNEQIYMFFPFTGAQPQREPPYGDFAFNLRPSYRQETAGLVRNLLRIGRRRIGVFYQADAYGRSGWAGVRLALAEERGQIAGEATYQRGARFTGSMREQVDILRSVDPDAVVCVGAYAACAAFARDAADNGLDVPIANLSFVGSESMVGLLGNTDHYTRMLVNSQVVPSYEDASVPAVREYRELMAKHDPRVPEGLGNADYEPLAHSFVSFEGFLNAKMICEIFRRFPGDPDRAGLEEAVFSIRDFDIGIAERVSFGPDRRQGLQQVYYTVVEDGRFVPLTDWRRRFTA